MENIIKQGAHELGIDITDEQTAKLLKYAEILKEWNKKMNLTAIRDDEGIAVKHFLDSMSVLKTGKIGKKVIDVGTGAGFPGMVIKIMRPETELTLLDSLNKRITFLKALGEELEINGTDEKNGIEYIHARAEDAGRDARLRAAFDTVVSRAVANMTTLSEWCIPFIKKGGYFMALKGPAADEEIKAAKRMISVLGGEEEETFEARIPFSELEHKIIIIKKTRQTPLKFPRKPGISTKFSARQCYNLRK